MGVEPQPLMLRMTGQEDNDGISEADVNMTAGKGRKRIIKCYDCGHLGHV